MYSFNTLYPENVTKDRREITFAEMEEKTAFTESFNRLEDVLSHMVMMTNSDLLSDQNFYFVANEETKTILYC